MGNVKDFITMVGAPIAVIGAMLLGVRGCNMACNNRQINKPAYQTISYATGLSGHLEYTRYSDGSQDVKIYPGIGHRIWDSELYQDLNCDGLVDRIRRNGAEWKMNKLSELLVRKHDYETNKKRFDKADKRLNELIDEYSK